MGCRRIIGVWVVLVVLSLIGLKLWIGQIETRTLVEWHATLNTQILLETNDTAPVEPPTDVFELVQYDAPLGRNYAYVTPAVDHRRPGVVYIAGGMDWGIRPDAWEPAPWTNDQSGRAFLGPDFTLMRPSLRGSNGNPGHNECMFGEIDDILAAADYLAARSDVDPDRLYLVGHSSGATMVVLAAELTSRFRSVFAIGTATGVLDYGEDCGPESLLSPESLVRSPLSFIEEATGPLFLIEGVDRPSNADLLPEFERWSGQATRILEVPGLDHFSVLGPTCAVIARAILEDNSPEFRMTLLADDIVAEADVQRAESDAQQAEYERVLEQFDDADFDEMQPEEAEDGTRMGRSTNSEIP